MGTEEVPAVFMVFFVSRSKVYIYLIVQRLTLQLVLQCKSLDKCRYFTDLQL